MYLEAPEGGGGRVERHIIASDVNGARSSWHLSDEARAGARDVWTVGEADGCEERGERTTPPLRGAEEVGGDGDDDDDEEEGDGGGTEREGAESDEEEEGELASDLCAEAARVMDAALRVRAFEERLPARAHGFRVLVDRIRELDRRDGGGGGGVEERRELCDRAVDAITGAMRLCWLGDFGTCDFERFNDEYCRRANWERDISRCRLRPGCLRLRHSEVWATVRAARGEFDPRSMPPRERRDDEEEEGDEKERLSREAIEGSSKPCPSCWIPITHFARHGCHQIVCPACKTRFCYACLREDVVGPEHDACDGSCGCSECDPGCRECASPPKDRILRMMDGN